jgi:phage terminase large subunit
LKIQLPAAFKGLREPHRYKAYFGGRGSAKSHSFATELVLRAAREPTRIVCAREIQNNLRDSVKQLIEDKIEALGLGAAFDCQDKVTKGPNGSQFVYIGMWRNPDAVRSMEGADIFWGEEASAFSDRSLKIVRPSMRKPGSELWFSWNPEFEHDPIDRFFRGGNPPPDSLIREVSWRDNPWFDETPLKDERDYDYDANPAGAEHVWGGGYVTAVEGSYYAAQLLDALAKGRIGPLEPDPILRVRAFWDLGRRDATAIWIAQFVGRSINVLDYIEGQGQHISFYVEELRRRGYDTALMVLPHDGAAQTVIAPGSAREQLTAAGFDVDVIPNQGKGAALNRVEASRRLFPNIWFADEQTRAGRKALGAYHERRDDKRNVGLGPEHDWASDPADAFGLMCVAYEAPMEAKKAKRVHATAGGWLG